MNKALLYVGLSICLLGCSKTPIGENQQLPSDGEEVVVSLGLGGEVTISETPLSRAAGSETSSKDLYGINVYYDKEKDGLLNDVYAYGLFDNVADMVITLVTGYKYKFECRMVVDGKNKCLISKSSYYGRPFISETSNNDETYNSGGQYYKKCSNRFLIGGSFDRYLRRGYVDPYGYEVDNYYGEVSSYTPTKNGVVSIDMKRCTYGLTINVSGVTKGTASVSFNYSGGTDDELGTYISTVSGFSGGFSTTSDKRKTYDVISFDDLYGCWEGAVNQQVYSVTIPIRIYWSYTYEGTNVTETFEKYRAVTLKRNVMTTVDINLNIDTNGQADKSLSLSMETSNMTNSGYTFDYDINLDGTIDNPVDPK